MPAFLIPWLLRLGALIVVGLFLYGIWWKVDHWCNSRCAEVTDRAEAAERVLALAKERATAMALLWAKAIEQVEVRYVEVERVRTERAANLRERASAIQGSASVVIGPVAADILRDTERLANNAPDTPTPRIDQGPAQEVPVAAWVEFAIDAAEAYRDAADKHMACVAWANAITEAQRD